MAYSRDDEEGFVSWEYIKLKIKLWILNKQLDRLHKKIKRVKKR
jgi:hypothetical protein